MPHAASHHLCKVLRADVGTTIELFNGDGKNYAATLLTTGKNATAKVQAETPGLPKPALSLELIQGISRADRMDTSLQKAVELGVNRIWPVFTEKSAVRLQGERLEKKFQHWLGVIISACEQSGRSGVPQLMQAQSLSTWVDNLPENGSNWLFAPESEITIGDAPQPQTPCRLLVGPESGLSDTEIALCEDAGFSSISLGPRILRTETAGPAALAILQSRFGDLKKTD